ncbi:MAG: putative tRNA/rRNA methyltransferase [Rhodospirillales bacterium]|nr:putative tRNA/rRNA methyltransferase [Rhodospirillales bacterium]
MSDLLDPVIILVEPQLGENIGAAARAMLNCGLTRMRIVRPRDGWPNPRASAAASGADSVIEAAEIFDSTSAAIADLNYVLATTARQRDMVKTILTPEVAAEELHARAATGHRTGILFGPERTGLMNDDIPLADAVVTIPVNPVFSSLNLAQGVLLIGYCWWRMQVQREGRRLEVGGNRPATKVELENLFVQLEKALEEGGFYTTEQQRPSMVRNMRNLLQRASMTEQEVRTFHGVIAALNGTAGSAKEKRRPR